MNGTWKDLFTFSRREQGGIAVLLALLLALMALRPLLPLFVRTEPVDISEFRKQAQAYQQELERLDSLQKQKKIHRPAKNYSRAETVETPATLYPFDPNLATGDELIRTGLSEFTARNIVKYREKGGKFLSVKDLGKIYGMDRDWLETVTPYLIFPVSTVDDHRDPADSTEGKRTAYKVHPESSHSRKKFFLDLNSADSAKLDSLPGIGPSFARRILSYRELLGGYYTPLQLLEVTGMDSVKFRDFRDEVWTDTALIRRIDINTVTFKELLRHPYFDYYLVKAILQYRDKKKRIGAVEELRSLPEIYPELYEKISPYLEVGKE